MNVLVTPEYVTFIVNGNQTTVYSDEAYFKEVIEAVKNKNETLLAEIADNRNNLVKPVYEKIFGDNVVIDESGDVLVDGSPIPEALSERIKFHRENGLPLEPLINFVIKLRKNPSGRSRLELFDFLKDQGLPIDDDGDFYAYKAVRNDYFSKKAGKLTLIHGVEKEGRIYNAPGEYIECDRGSVDDDRTHECSFGLHAGRLEYATKTYYGPTDKVVIVKINPKDVVSVPKDYNASKLRTAAYRVVEDYTGPLPDHVLNEEEYLDEYDEDYLDEYFGSEIVPCEAQCSSCTCSGPRSLQKGDIVSFRLLGYTFKDVMVGKVQGDTFWGINDDGFGSWNIAEVEEWIV